MVFLIFLLLWPAAEFALFSQVAARAGIPATVLLCAATAATGFLLLHWQRMNALIAWREMAAGKPQSLRPGPLTGIFTVIAALLLILPGFLSDAAALLLLLPPVRQALYAALRRRFAVPGSADPQPQREHGVIEGEFTRLDGADEALLHSPPNQQQGRS